MKILLYSSKFPPQIGGVENVLKYLDYYFSKANTVKVVTSLNLNLKAPNFIQKLFKGFKVSTNDGGHVSFNFMSIPRSFFGYISFIYRFPASVFVIRKEINKFNPDVINAHFLDDSLYYFYFSTLGVKSPIYLDIHGNELHLFSQSILYKLFMQKVINKSKKIIVHSEYMANELSKVYVVNKSRVEIVPNGVDIKHFSNKTKSTGVGEYFLYVGRFDKKKGIEVLLRAYKKVEKKLTKKLVLVGDGKGEESHGKLSAKTLSQKYKSDKIKFTGLISNKDVVKCYENAYFTVFPSLHEPFGIVALESIAMGVPFIASSGGFNEIINKTGCGFSFKAGNVAELANIMLKVDSDHKLKEDLKKRCIRESKKYGWENIASEYLKVFNA